MVMLLTDIGGSERDQGGWEKITYCSECPSDIQVPLTSGTWIVVVA